MQCYAANLKLSMMIPVIVRNRLESVSIMKIFNHVWDIHNSQIDLTVGIERFRSILKAKLLYNQVLWCKLVSLSSVLYSCYYGIDLYGIIAQTLKKINILLAFVNCLLYDRLLCWASISWILSILFKNLKSGSDYGNMGAPMAILGKLRIIHSSLPPLCTRDNIL